MTIRNPEGLKPGFRKQVQQLIKQCNNHDVDVLIYCTYRSPAEQARVFRRGRRLAEIQAKADELARRWDRPDLADCLIRVGPQMERHIRTYAGPGESVHQYMLAADGVPIRNGKLVWGDKDSEDLELWNIYGEVAEHIGLEWAGRWTKFREFPHVQAGGFDWKDKIKDHDFDFGDI